MSTVAEQLRQAREALGLEIAEVAERTKMKSEHVRALEEGNYDVFIAPVYIRGFTRTYATLLKLDVRQVMALLDVELGHTKKFSAPPSLDPHQRGVLDFIMLQVSRVNWRIALPLAFLVLLVAGGGWGYAAWRRYKTADPLSNLGPGLYQPKATTGGEYLSFPAAPTNTSSRKP